MEELREEFGGRESRQGKNGGAEEGGWCVRESRQGKNGGAERGGWWDTE